MQLKLAFIVGCAAASSGSYWKGQCVHSCILSFIHSSHVLACSWAHCHLGLLEPPAVTVCRQCDIVENLPGQCRVIYNFYNLHRQSIGYNLSCVPFFFKSARGSQINQEKPLQKQREHAHFTHYVTLCMWIVLLLTRPPVASASFPMSAKRQSVPSKVMTDIMTL